MWLRSACNFQLFIIVVLDAHEMVTIVIHEHLVVL